MGSGADGNVGWSRTAQDTAEAAFPSDVTEPERRPFLDRPVGFVTVRWAFVFIGAIVGVIVEGVVSLATFSDSFGILAVYLAPLGALVGGLVVGLVLLVSRRDRS